MELNNLQRPETNESSESNRYLEKLKLVASLAPNTLDHISDILVMVQLVQRNKDQLILFWIALLIDLLPGPITVYQFFRFGFGLKSLTLIFHPINAYLHTFLILTGFAKLEEGFSRRVVEYSTEVQGLVESPIQLIYTLTLMSLGFLDTPQKSSKDETYTKTNSFGLKISFSFVPILSVASSFMAIVINSGRAIKILEISRLEEKAEVLGWFLFLTSTLLFRIQIWVLLSTFLAEYILIAVIVIFAINVPIFINVNSKLKADPVLSSFYSLTFPLVSLALHDDLEDLMSKFSILKNVYKKLTILGNLVLIGFFGFVATKVQENDFSHSPEIHIRRDFFLPVIISTSTLFSISVVSAFALTRKESWPPQTPSVWIARLRKIFFEGIKIILFVSVFATFAFPFSIPKTEIEVNLLIKEICGAPANLTIKGFALNKNESDDMTNRILHNCKNERGFINPLGCLGEFTLVPDYRPASPLVQFSPQDKLIMVSPAQQHYKELETLVTQECSKGVRVVCYLTYYLHILPEHVDPKLCTHIVYLFNDIDKEKFIIKPFAEDTNFEKGNFTLMKSLKSNQTKVMLSVGGPEFDDKIFSRLVSKEANRRNFIEQSIPYLINSKFDGLEIFWESPVVWGYDNVIKSHCDKQNFQKFMEELSTAFKEEGLILSCVVTSLDKFQQAFEIQNISKVVDFISLYSWDLEGSWSNRTGFGNAIKSERIDTLTLTNRVEGLVNHGVDKQKLVIGLQTQAFQFQLISYNENGLYAPINANVFNRLAFSEVCEKYREGGWKIKQVPNQGTYITRGNQWISFYTPQDMKEKVKWIEESGFGGAVIFTLEYDDFLNKCGCEEFPLLRAVNRQFGRPYLLELTEQTSKCLTFEVETL